MANKESQVDGQRLCRANELAQRLGVSRLTVPEILHEKRPLTPDMAIRIGRLLGNGPGVWLRMQTALDVWQLEQRGGYEHIEPLNGESA